jgi:hypothetical protein
LIRVSKNNGFLRLSSFWLIADHRERPEAPYLRTRLIEGNPMSFIGPVDESDGEREIYVSKANFEAIVTQCPHWVQVIVLCFYMTGMRANEELVLTPEHVDLDKRIIRLRKDETKEKRHSSGYFAARGFGRPAACHGERPAACLDHQCHA